MIRRLVFVLIFIASTLFAQAQKLYDETADWKQQVETALQSAQRQNKQLLSFTDFADRFGFPVLIIYDKQGRRLHTQSTDLLEKGESYDKEKVLRVFKNWTPDAVSGKLRRK